MQLNPIFRNEHSKTASQTNRRGDQKISPSLHRQTHRKKRWDATKDIKIPVTANQRRELRMYFKHYQSLEMTTSQTVFHTQLLRYMLKHPEYILWDLSYSDTKQYIHVKPNQVEYQMIGGVHGWAIKKNLSERQTTHRILISGLLYLNQGGRLSGEDIQPIRPPK